MPPPWAVPRVLAGESPRAVADRLDVHRGTAGQGRRGFREGGAAARASPVGPGRPRPRTPKQEAQRKRLILGKAPRPLRCRPARGTLRLVGARVARRCGVVRPMAPPRPRAGPAGDPPAEAHPAGLPAGPHSGRGGEDPGPPPPRPGGPPPAGRLGLRGTRRGSGRILRWAGRGGAGPAPGGARAGDAPAAWQALCRTFRKPLIVLQDSHPAPVAAATQRVFQARGERLTGYHLPGYAPDLTPEEPRSSHLKRLVRHHPSGRAAASAARVAGTMGERAGDRAAGRKFFEHPAVAHIRKALTREEIWLMRI